MNPFVLLILVDLLIIYLNFRDLPLTLIIFTQIPIAIFGGMIGLGLFGVEMNTAVWVGLIALIGFTTMPLAPPRYMPEFGFTDTIIHAQSYYIFQSPKIVNQYAAMPSLHFGWDLLVAVAIFVNTRNRWLRIAVCIMPFWTLGGIVLTANHYFLDAVAGAAVAACGLSIAWVLRMGIPREGKLSFLT